MERTTLRGGISIITQQCNRKGNVRMVFIVLLPLTSRSSIYIAQNRWVSYSRETWKRWITGKAQEIQFSELQSTYLTHLKIERKII